MDTERVDRAYTWQSANESACKESGLWVRIRHSDRPHNVGDVREAVLIVQNVVVRRTRRPEKTCVALQVEVELRRMDDVAVHHRTRGAVPAAVLVLRPLREEPDMVALLNHDDRDERVDL